MRFPVDVSNIKDDVILVADEWNHRVQQFHVRTGEVIKRFGSFGSGDEEFASLVGVCLDENGHIFAAELNNKYRLEMVKHCTKLTIPLITR